jgi:hypothetical protein
MSTPSASAGATRIPIIDKALSSGKSEVSASAFAFLFSELVQYSLHRVKAVEDLEKRYPPSLLPRRRPYFSPFLPHIFLLRVRQTRGEFIFKHIYYICILLLSVFCRLEDVGYGIGMRVLELLVHRDKANRKETNLIAMLQFVTTSVWRSLFGKVADGLEKADKSEDTCASARRDQTAFTDSLCFQESPSEPHSTHVFCFIRTTPSPCHQIISATRILSPTGLCRCQKTWAR